MIPKVRQNGRTLPATSADVQSWQARMRAAVLAAVGETEITGIVEAIVAKAKGGDLQAARLVLAYAVGSPATGTHAPSSAPTSAWGGTADKLDILAYRHANGLPLHQDGDGGDVDLS